MPQTRPPYAIPHSLPLPPKVSINPPSLPGEVLVAGKERGEPNPQFP
jgi:hypothetical protein